VNVELSSIYSKSNGTAETAKAAKGAVVSSGDVTSTPVQQRKTTISEIATTRKIISKGQLQVYALLQHPRFGRLCLAYFLVSLAFETPFVHLTRFALDQGELHMLLFSLG